MNFHWSDAVGIAGVAAVLLAYLLLQSGRLPSEAPGYSLLNLAGALAILVSLFYAFNLSSVVIQLAWIAISLYGLKRAMLKRWRR
jgi:hypothetical protein